MEIFIKKFTHRKNIFNIMKIEKFLNKIHKKKLQKKAYKEAIMLSLWCRRIE